MASVIRSTIETPEHYPSPDERPLNQAGFLLLRPTMNGKPMNALEYYAQLAAAGRQVPQGNPIADHYQERADKLGRTAGTLMTGGGALAGLSLAEIVDGNPLAVLGLLAGGAIGAGGGSGAGAMGNMRQDTADMWFNRFGSGDPNQGLPGTPSGPAYRRR